MHMSSTLTPSALGAVARRRFQVSKDRLKNLGRGGAEGRVRDQAVGGYR